MGTSANEIASKLRNYQNGKKQTASSSSPQQVVNAVKNSSGNTQKAKWTKPEGYRKADAVESFTQGLYEFGEDVTDLFGFNTRFNEAASKIMSGKGDIGDFVSAGANFVGGLVPGSVGGMMMVPANIHEAATGVDLHGMDHGYVDSAPLSPDERIASGINAAVDVAGFLPWSKAAKAIKGAAQAGEAATKGVASGIRAGAAEAAEKSFKNKNIFGRIDSAMDVVKPSAKNSAVGQWIGKQADELNPLSENFNKAKSAAYALGTGALEEGPGEALQGVSEAVRHLPGSQWEDDEDINWSNVWSNKDVMTDAAWQGVAGAAGGAIFGGVDIFKTNKVNKKKDEINTQLKKAKSEETLNRLISEGETSVIAGKRRTNLASNTGDIDVTPTAKQTVADYQNVNGKNVGQGSTSATLVPSLVDATGGDWAVTSETVEQLLSTDEGLDAFCNLNGLDNVDKNDLRNALIARTEWKRQARENPGRAMDMTQDPLYKWEKKVSKRANDGAGLAFIFGKNPFTGVSGDVKAYGVRIVPSTSAGVGARSLLVDRMTADFDGDQVKVVADGAVNAVPLFAAAYSPEIGEDGEHVPNFDTESWNEVEKTKEAKKYTEDLLDNLLYGICNNAEMNILRDYIDQIWVADDDGNIVDVSSSAFSNMVNFLYSKLSKAHVSEGHINRAISAVLRTMRGASPYSSQMRSNIKNNRRPNIKYIKKTPDGGKAIDANMMLRERLNVFEVKLDSILDDILTNERYSRLARIGKIYKEIEAANIAAQNDVAYPTDMANANYTAVDPALVLQAFDALYGNDTESATSSDNPKFRRPASISLSTKTISYETEDGHTVKHSYTNEQFKIWINAYIKYRASISENEAHRSNDVTVVYNAFCFKAKPTKKFKSVQEFEEWLTESFMPVQNMAANAVEEARTELDGINISIPQRQAFTNKSALTSEFINIFGDTKLTELFDITEQELQNLGITNNGISVKQFIQFLDSDSFAAKSNYNLNEKNNSVVEYLLESYQSRLDKTEKSLEEVARELAKVFSDNYGGGKEAGKQIDQLRSLFEKAQEIAVEEDRNLRDVILELLYSDENISTLTLNAVTTWLDAINRVIGGKETLILEAYSSITFMFQKLWRNSKKTFLDVVLDGTDGVKNLLVSMSIYAHFADVVQDLNLLQQVANGYAVDEDGKLTQHREINTEDVNAMIEQIRLRLSQFAGVSKLYDDIIIADLRATLDKIESDVAAGKRVNVEKVISKTALFKLSNLDESFRDKEKYIEDKSHGRKVRVLSEALENTAITSETRSTLNTRAVEAINTLEEAKKAFERDIRQEVEKGLETLGEMNCTLQEVLEFSAYVSKEAFSLSDVADAISLISFDGNLKEKGKARVTGQVLSAIVRAHRINNSLSMLDDITGQIAQQVTLQELLTNSDIFCEVFFGRAVVKIIDEDGNTIEGGDVIWDQRTLVRHLVGPEYTLLDDDISRAGKLSDQVIRQVLKRNPIIADLFCPKTYAPVEYGGRISVVEGLAKDFAETAEWLADPSDDGAGFSLRSKDGTPTVKGYERNLQLEVQNIMLDNPEFYMYVAYCTEKPLWQINSVRGKREAYIQAYRKFEKLITTWLVTRESADMYGSVQGYNTQGIDQYVKEHLRINLIDKVAEIEHQRQHIQDLQREPIDDAAHMAAWVANNGMRETLYKKFRDGLIDAAKAHAEEIVASDPSRANDTWDPGLGLGPFTFEEWANLEYESPTVPATDALIHDKTNSIEAEYQQAVEDTVTGMFLYRLFYFDDLDILSSDIFLDEIHKETMRQYEEGRATLRAVVDALTDPVVKAAAQEKLNQLEKQYTILDGDALREKAISRFYGYLDKVVNGVNAAFNEATNTSIDRGIRLYTNVSSMFDEGVTRSTLSKNFDAYIETITKAGFNLSEEQLAFVNNIRNKLLYLNAETGVKFRSFAELYRYSFAKADKSAAEEMENDLSQLINDAKKIVADAVIREWIDISGTGFAVSQKVSTISNQMLDKLPEFVQDITKSIKEDKTSQGYNALVGLAGTPSNLPIDNLSKALNDIQFTQVFDAPTSVMAAAFVESVSTAYIPTFTGIHGAQQQLLALPFLGYATPSRRRICKHALQQIEDRNSYKPHTVETLYEELEKSAKSDKDGITHFVIEESIAKKMGIKISTYRKFYDENGIEVRLVKDPMLAPQPMVVLENSPQVRALLVANEKNLNMPVDATFFKSGGCSCAGCHAHGLIGTAGFSDAIGRAKDDGTSNPLGEFIQLLTNKAMEALMLKRRKKAVTSTDAKIYTQVPQEYLANDPSGYYVAWYKRNPGFYDDGRFSDAIEKYRESFAKQLVELTDSSVYPNQGFDLNYAQAYQIALICTSRIRLSFRKLDNSYGHVYVSTATVMEKGLASAISEANFDSTQYSGSEFTDGPRTQGLELQIDDITSVVMEPMTLSAVAKNCGKQLEKMRIDGLVDIENFADKCYEIIKRPRGFFVHRNEEGQVIGGSHNSNTFEKVAANLPFAKVRPMRNIRLEGELSPTQKMLESLGEVSPSHKNVVVITPEDFLSGVEKHNPEGSPDVNNWEVVTESSDKTFSKGGIVVAATRINSKINEGNYYSEYTDGADSEQKTLARQMIADTKSGKFDGSGFPPSSRYRKEDSRPLAVWVHQTTRREYVACIKDAIVNDFDLVMLKSEYNKYIQNSPDIWQGLRPANYEVHGNFVVLKTSLWRQRQNTDLKMANSLTVPVSARNSDIYGMVLITDLADAKRADSEAVAIIDEDTALFWDNYRFFSMAPTRLDIPSLFNLGLDVNDFAGYSVVTDGVEIGESLRSIVDAAEESDLTNLWTKEADALERAYERQDEVDEEFKEIWEDEFVEAVDDLYVPGPVPEYMDEFGVRVRPRQVRVGTADLGMVSSTISNADGTIIIDWSYYAQITGPNRRRMIQEIKNTVTRMANGEEAVSIGSCVSPDTVLGFVHVSRQKNGRIQNIYVPILASDKRRDTPSLFIRSIPTIEGQHIRFDTAYDYSYVDAYGRNSTPECKAKVIMAGTTNKVLVTPQSFAGNVNEALTKYSRGQEATKIKVVGGSKTIVMLVDKASIQKRESIKIPTPAMKDLLSGNPNISFLKTNLWNLQKDFGSALFDKNRTDLWHSSILGDSKVWDKLIAGDKETIRKYITETEGHFFSSNYWWAENIFKKAFKNILLRSSHLDGGLTPATMFGVANSVTSEMADFYRKTDISYEMFFAGWNVDELFGLFHVITPELCPPSRYSDIMETGNGNVYQSPISSDEYIVDRHGMLLDENGERQIAVYTRLNYTEPGPHDVGSFRANVSNQEEFRTIFDNGGPKNDTELKHILAINNSNIGNKFTAMALNEDLSFMSIRGDARYTNKMMDTEVQNSILATIPGLNDCVKKLQLMSQYCNSLPNFYVTEGDNGKHSVGIASPEMKEITDRIAKVIGWDSSTSGPMPPKFALNLLVTYYMGCTVDTKGQFSNDFELNIKSLEDVLPSFEQDFQNAVGTVEQGELQHFIKGKSIRSGERLTMPMVSLDVMKMIIRHTNYGRALTEATRDKYESNGEYLGSAELEEMTICSAIDAMLEEVEIVTTEARRTYADNPSGFAAYQTYIDALRAQYAMNATLTNTAKNKIQFNMEEIIAREFANVYREVYVKRVADTFFDTSEERAEFLENRQAAEEAIATIAKRSATQCGYTYRIAGRDYWFAGPSKQSSTLSRTLQSLITWQRTCALANPWIIPGSFIDKGVNATTQRMWERFAMSDNRFRIARSLEESGFWGEQLAKFIGADVVEGGRYAAEHLSKDYHNAVKAFSRNRQVVILYKAMQMLALNGEEFANLCDMKTPQEIRAHVKKLMSHSSDPKWIARAKKFSDWVMRIASADDCFVSHQVRTFVDAFLQNEAAWGNTIWFQKVPGSEMTFIETLLINEPMKFLRIVLDPNNGVSFINAAAARNTSLISALGHKNIASIAWGMVAQKHTAVDLAMCTFGTKFITYSFNILTRVLKPIAPISSLIHKVELYFMRAGMTDEEGNAINLLGKVMPKEQRELLAAQVMMTREHQSLRTATISDITCMGLGLFAMMLTAFIPLDPPEDDDKWGDVGEWYFFGLRINSVWWIRDTIGIALHLAAYWRSCLLGNGTPSLLYDGVYEFCVQRGIENTSFVFELAADPIGAIENQFGDADWSKYVGGEPTIADQAAILFERTGYGILNQFIPSFIRSGYRTGDGEFERSYNRIWSEDQYGQVISDEEGNASTEYTTWMDAQRRKLSRNNLAAAIGYNLGNGTPFPGGDTKTNSYWNSDMPLVTIKDAAELASADALSIYEDDGETLRSDYQAVTAEIICTLIENDDMNALRESGYYIPYETKLYISAEIARLINLNKYNYYDEYDSTFADYYGEYSEEIQEALAKAAEKNVNSTLDELKTFYYEKLWSEAMRRPLQEYNRYKTTYKQDANGNWYATGYSPNNDWGSLGIFTTPGHTNSNTAGREGDWATLSAITEKGMYDENGNPMRALVPVSDTEDVPDLEEFLETTASDLANGAYRNYGGYGYGGYSYGGGGGGGGGSYARTANRVYPSTSKFYDATYRDGRTRVYGHRVNFNKANLGNRLSSKKIYDTTLDYLRPGFETKGSREAYRRQDF